ncbi:YbjQ family protein [Actinomadura oligospora]|uniref:YbjQ family protein n=1 Tax=Actinomadura oligospora TaxID=111804 RepID=UPI000478D4E1|nr:heavy metal-binding domain-containing protein [Actinomadura oligospora]
MLIVTTDALAGYAIRGMLGEALGVAVQTDQAAPGAGSSGTFRMNTGEQTGAGLLAARRQAVERMAEDARRKGANAVVGMRLDAVALGAGGGHEVCAYGTAVWVEPVQNVPNQPQQNQPQQYPQGGGVPPYNPESTPGGPPMAARNLTMGLRDPSR